MEPSVTRTLLIQKIIALAVTLGLFFYINNAYNFMLAAIVLGYGHFFMGYFYKLMSRRIKVRNFLIFIAMTVGLFAFFYRIDFPDYRIESLLFVTTVYAIYHTITDDQFTLNFFKPVYTKYQKTLMLMLIFTLTGLHTHWQFASPFALMFILLGLYFFIYYFYLTFRESRKIPGTDYLFLGQGLFALVLYATNYQIYFSRMIMVSFIGVYHYLLFYFHYYSKIVSNPNSPNILNRKPIYLTLVILSNIFFAGLYFFTITTRNQPLSYFYGYNLFLVLTLMHFISSTRIHEFFTLLEI